MKRHVNIFLIIVVALCMFGIFALIFPDFSAMMILCTVTGTILASLLICGINLSTSASELHPKNTSSLWVATAGGILLFAWTLIYVFLCGDYSDSQRSLDGLYIGYLIVLVITVVSYFSVSRGSEVAQFHSDMIQQRIVTKQELIQDLQRNFTTVEEYYGSPSDEIKEYRMCIDLLRRLPNSVIENTSITSRISDAIYEVVSNLADTEATKRNITKLKHVLKSL